MRNFVMKHIAAVLVITGLWSCNVHQWPEKEEIIPMDSGIKIPLRLEYEPDFYVWEHNYDPLLGNIEEAHPNLNIYPDYPGTSRKYTQIVPDGLLLVHVQVFSTSSGRLVKEQIFTREIDGSYDTDFELDLPDEGTYNVVVWSQLLEHAGATPFYVSSDFRKIHINPDSYDGNTDYRDAFRGRIRIDASATTDERHVVPMKRPMGKFELVTTDLSEFLEKETTRRNLSVRSIEEYRVKISFWYYMNSYSAIDDDLESTIQNVSFETTMTITGENEASLGFDYVLLSGDFDTSFIQTRVDVYDLGGAHVAGVKQTFLNIPMRRNHHTLLRGSFLMMEGDGGIGINPDFENDFNFFPTW